MRSRFSSTLAGLVRGYSAYHFHRAAIARPIFFNDTMRSTVAYAHRRERRIINTENVSFPANESRGQALLEK